MKCKIIVCLLSLLSFVITANAQVEIAFSPDCPGATTGPDIMPRWSIDWETGSSYEWNRRNGAHEHTWTINTSLFRLGLTTNVELRFQLDESATLASQKLYGGISNASVGTKIKVFEGAERPAESSLPWDNSPSRKQSISLSPQAYRRSIPPVV